jgi:putative heme-binding domain-containing protein
MTHRHRIRNWLAPALIILVANPATGWQADRPGLPGRRPREVVDGDLPENNPYNSAADLALGRKLFLLRCAMCHGANGEGGRGISLASGDFRHGSTDREVFLTIRKGVPNSEMPRSRASTVEVWRLVACVKQFASAETAEKSAGDPGAGRAVYSGRGCSQCHIVDGQGGDLGPALTAIGRRRSLRYLRDSITDPAADVPPQYLTAHVTTLDGTQLRGIHLNEDDYSIQLRDAAGNLHAFLKTELRSFGYDKDSMMPPYRSLPPADLENLVAYLKSLH